MEAADPIVKQTRMLDTYTAGYTARLRFGCRSQQAAGFPTVPRSKRSIRPPWRTHGSTLYDARGTSRETLVQSTSGEISAKNMKTLQFKQ